MSNRRSSPGKAPLDHCKPEEMVDVLLARIPNSPLSDERKAILAVELEDLYWFFQKHLDHVNMFRTDLLEWRGFLKQSKEYVNEFFDEKLNKTRRIVEFVKKKTKKPSLTLVGESHPTMHYNRTSHKPPGWDPRDPEPTFIEILFRPGIRSIREYPITKGRYGEHNNDIDQLHRLTALLREEIIHAPLTKISRQMKNELLNIVISIVRITAYDVLYGLVFLEHLSYLFQHISQGDEHRKKEMIDIMKMITSKLQEHTRVVWEKSKTVEKRMWDNILAIEKHLKQGEKPKFEQEILVKSEFLKLEKLKQPQPTKHPIIVEAAMSGTVKSSASTEESIPERLLLTNPPPSEVSTSQPTPSTLDPSKPCTRCNEYREKYGEDFLKAMKEPERMYKIYEIPEGKETETLFKMKRIPKLDCSILRKIKLPTQPSLFDAEDTLKTAIRINVPQDEKAVSVREGIDYKQVNNPYLNRKRLFKYH